MNQNLKNIAISGIRQFYNKVKDVDGAISLTLGQPDFKVPELVKNSLINAINKDKTTYTPNAGIDELREEISKYLKNRNINYSKDEVCLTVGGSEALYSVISSLINPGDKVLIPSPAYPAYENIVNIIGGEVINYSLKSDFSIDIDIIKKSLEENDIKVLFLSFPTNPTGAILSKDDKESLCKILLDKDIIIVTDEIYEPLCFEEYNSIAQNEKLLNKVVYISGFSKMFSMTGLRLGYFCCQKPLFDEIMKVHQYNVSCAPSIVQYAVLEGLKNCMGDVESMKLEFIQRKNYLIEGLKKLSINPGNPKGAFYIFADIRKFGLSSDEFCTRLLYEAKVACVPGSAFGEKGEGYIRISYCYSIVELEEALNRIENWVKENFKNVIY